MLSSYTSQLAAMQQEAFRNLYSQQSAIMQSRSLTGIGMIAGMAAYSPPPPPVYDQMRYELNKWLEDWNK